MAKSFPSVPGFSFGGIACGIKSTGALDLGVILAEREVPTAAVFTRNRVRAAPVVLASKRVRRRKSARAILVNSGNANACTGSVGDDAALRMTDALARALGVAPASILPASTGVIGVPLPVERIEGATPALLDSTSTRSEPFARAILTTDAGPKVARATFSVGKQKYRVGGFAKGAGMIHPDMATTLAFVCTDAPIAAPALETALRDATDRTFNRISVDGDTSTNDSIFLMASGSARELTGRGLTAFSDALHGVLDSLAQMIIADGEGAEHRVRIRVERARSTAQALKIARTIATSPLVKTALHGCDPNWGRVLAAAGRSGARFDPRVAELFIGSVRVAAHGLSMMNAASEKRAAKIMTKPAYEIRLVLHEGKAEAHYDTCDLGHEYIRINADYRS